MAIAALGLMLALAGAAPAAQSPSIGADETLSVEVQLVEQTACLIDPASFLVSFLIHTTYPNDSAAPLSLALSSEWVTRVAIARDQASLATGRGVREFVASGPTPSLAPGHVVTAAPGWAVAGRVLAWVPVSISPEPVQGALVPGDYVVQLTLQVLAGRGPAPGGSPAGDLVPVRAITRPLAIHIPAPRQEQECGSAAAPLLLVAPPGV